MHNLNSELNQLKGVLEAKISQPYVKQIIQKPFIDEDKLVIATFLFKNQPISIDKKERYIITMMLIQLALDIHELIPGNNDKPIDNEEKQLSVLVGDYYSGLYYYLLSELKDIEMIQLIASSIKEINEHKMKLYDGNIYSFDDLLYAFEVIESEHFVRIAKHMNEQAIIPIIKKFLMYNRLKQEKRRMLNREFTNVDYYLRNELMIGDRALTLSTVDQKMNTYIQEIDELLVDLPYDFKYFKIYIRKRLGITYKTFIAEEG